MYLSFSCRIRGVGVKIRDAVKVLFSFSDWQCFEGKSSDRWTEKRKSAKEGIGGMI